jgi:hypothetical protein
MVMRQGLFYDAHRAEMDCHAVLEMLSRVLPKSGRRAMKVLFDKHSHIEKLVYAMDTKFETKDILKERGYSWSGGDNGKPKAWYVRLAEEDYQAEVDWLAERIYGYRKFLLNHEVVDAVSRYSRRSKGITPGWVVPVKPVVEAASPSAPTAVDLQALRVARAQEALAKCEELLPGDGVAPVALSNWRAPVVPPVVDVAKRAVAAEPDTVVRSVFPEGSNFVLTPAGVGVVSSKPDVCAYCEGTGTDPESLNGQLTSACPACAVTAKA